MFRREAQRAQEQAEAAIELAREQGFARWLGVGMAWRGWALAERGAVQEGLAQIRQAPAIGLSQQPLRLAEVYGKAGHPEEALRELAAALAALAQNDERRFEAEFYRLQGELLLQRAVDQDLRHAAPGESATATKAAWTEATPASRLAVEAEACFRRALDVARSQQAKSLELRAVMSLGRLWQRQGRRGEARKLLEPVYGWFTEGFDTLDLQEAKALLEALQ
jgi:tetratricopeptide (TPR) repeat protein